MPATRVIWNEILFDEWIKDMGYSPQQGLYMLAVRVTVAMKAACPVSPNPYVAMRKSLRSGGTHYAGDAPLRPSGYLRRSVVRIHLPDGSWIIGPTADYAQFVNDGTPPHKIDSTGAWPLRNRITGQVFGAHVNHPGTTGAHFLERSLEAINGTAVHA